MAVASAWMLVMPAEREWIIGELLYDLRDFDEFFSTTRQFADLTCTVIILLIVWIYRRRDRAVIVPFVVALLLSGVATTVVKVTVGRSRPEYSVTIDTKRQVRMERYAGLNPDLGLKVGQHQILGLKPAQAFYDRSKRTGEWDKDD